MSQDRTRALPRTPVPVPSAAAPTGRQPWEAEVPVGDPEAPGAARGGAHLGARGTDGVDSLAERILDQLRHLS